MIVRSFATAESPPAAYLRDLLANEFALGHGLVLGDVGNSIGPVSSACRGRCTYKVWPLFS
jgi:hypothetical protein